MGGVEDVCEIAIAFAVEAVAEAMTRSDCWKEEGEELIGCAVLLDGDPVLAKPHFVGDGRQIPGTATGADGLAATERWMTPVKADP